MKEKEAIEESNQFTNVLNLQQDAILIYNLEDELGFYDEKTTTGVKDNNLESISIEYSNQQAT